ncbi:MAG: rhodanese-like domain-containing protein [Gammaproteobacteria bacterium]|nr:rhodanese-like domain-containing protein [Gammaproteobacteria bacterium]
MIQDLPPEAFKANLDNPNTILIDVREDWEFDLCSIKGAQLMPMSTIAQTYTKFDKDSNLAIYCHHGVRSMRVIHFLQSQGYENLINLQGGIDAWSSEIDSSVAKY